MSMTCRNSQQFYSMPLSSAHGMTYSADKADPVNSIIQDLRQRYKRLFVDDLQNASLPQLRLLRRIWGDSSVFFTVDENQVCWRATDRCIKAHIHRRSPRMAV